MADKNLVLRKQAGLISERTTALQESSSYNQEGSVEEVLVTSRNQEVGQTLDFCLRLLFVWVKLLRALFHSKSQAQSNGQYTIFLYILYFVLLLNALLEASAKDLSLCSFHNKLLKVKFLHCCKSVWCFTNGSLATSAGHEKSLQCHLLRFCFVLR